MSSENLNSRLPPPIYGGWSGTNYSPNGNYKMQPSYQRSQYQNNVRRSFKKPNTPICYLDKDYRFQSFLGRPFYDSRKPQAHKKLGAGGIIIDQDGKLLVVKGLTKWSLPKGHLEPGEKYHECAMREIKEEVNLKIHLEITDRYIDVKKCIYYIIVLSQLGPENLKTNDPHEISAVKWLTVEEIKKLDCNRQLDYVVGRWAYIQNIIRNSGDRIVRYPKCTMDPHSNGEGKGDFDDSEGIDDNGPVYFVPDFKGIRSGETSSENSSESMSENTGETTLITNQNIVTDQDNLQFSNDQSLEENEIPLIVKPEFKTESQSY